MCKIYRLSLEIPFVPKPLNVTLNMHYRKRHADNLAWDSYVWAETRGRLPTKPLTRAKIFLCRHSARTLDFDGLVGSMKPVVDALVDAGVLADDSWKVTGPWTVNQIFRTKKEGELLQIVIEEVDPGGRPA